MHAELNHFVVQQKSAQHCKSAALQQKGHLFELLIFFKWRQIHIAIENSLNQNIICPTLGGILSKFMKKLSTIL